MENLTTRMTVMVIMWIENLQTQVIEYVMTVRVKGVTAFMVVVARRCEKWGHGRWQNTAGMVVLPAFLPRTGNTLRE